MILLPMQGTRVEKVINELFEGHTLNFIECVNVEYKSSRRESFMDLQLDVKGCKDIYESFDRCPRASRHPAAAEVMALHFELAGKQSRRLAVCVCSVGWHRLLASV